MEPRKYQCGYFVYLTYLKAINIITSKFCNNCLWDKMDPQGFLRQQGTSRQHAVRLSALHTHTLAVLRTAWYGKLPCKGSGAPPNSARNHKQVIIIAANWRNTHTHMDCMHSLTHLHQYSYNNVVRSSSSVITEFGIAFLFWRYLKEGEQTRVPEEKTPQPAC